MDYKDLANLIFPDAKEISYYEEKYPERDLPEGAIVTRFAPSPTGFVHIGGLYQSLIARKLASQTNGVFFLRVEDTDQKREVENAVSGIVSSLKDFAIEPDEGMISEEEGKGNYGPYKQSQRKEIYQAYAKYLIEQGKAYPCFCTPEDVEEIRAKQEAAKIRPGYYGVWAKCRTVTVEEAMKKIQNGENYIIRFKSPGREDRKIQHHDVIKGKVDFPENDQDIVIIKADGLPTYHFAHAVDDHLMHTTHVIRGDEWLSSVPLHLQLFHELGFKAPKYAHIAPIMKNDNGNKRKLSKRKDAEAAVSYYAEEGIPAEAVKEYLMNIANSTFENWRRANPDKELNEFELQLNKMSVSGALFDMVKLFDVAKIVISRYSAEKVYNDSYAWAKKYDEELVKLLENKDYVFVWLTPGSGELEEQSKNKMNQLLKNRTTKTLNEVLTTGFEEQDTAFINWENVTKKGNTALRELEKSNLYDRIEQAQNNGIKFIVIIDEEHRNKTEKAESQFHIFYSFP